MSKSWVIGDWAAEAERAEEEEKARAAAAAAAPPEAFPSLSGAVATKSRKKKHQQTFTFAEFAFGQSVTHGSRTRSISDSRGLTAQEILMLPSGPRDRSGDQSLQGGLGGAFLDFRGGGHYGGDTDRFDQERDHGSGYAGGNERNREASGFLHNRDRGELSSADGSQDWSLSKRAVFPQGVGYDVVRRGSHDGERRGSHDGERRSSHDQERRGFRQVDTNLPPSRADEVANWGLVKKSLPLALGAHSSSRIEETRQRADGVDNWVSSRKEIAPSQTLHVQSRADEVANWISSKKSLAEGRDLQPRDTNADAPSNWGSSMQQQFPENLQRRPVVLTPQSHQWPPRHMNADITSALPPLGPKAKPNPFGSARPREEVLANRGADDVSRVDNEVVAKERDSRPSSSHSIRPGTPEVSVEPVVKPKLKKVNPFGNAKPREVLLLERGKDWRKIDFELEHRGVDRPDTQEEMALKEEIRILTELRKQEMESNAQTQKMNGDVLKPYVDPDTKLHLILEELRIKEKELQQLTMVLDDNVRYSQKFVERPGSRSGRSDVGRNSEFSERSGSRPGSRTGSRSGQSDNGSNHDPLERLGSVSGRRNLDASDRTHSLSEYGDGKGTELGERPWLRFGKAEGSRNQEAVERIGPWSGHNENRRSFESLQRPRWRTAAPLPTEVGDGADYSHQVSGADIWIRANKGIHDRQMNWRQQERVNERAGMRRF